ncbi:MAG TPA: hypothetical protein DEA90_00205 [Opitutae bacterium]|nr:hypothetical protein [Puniceicoccaceae bacterium]HBR92570.1 hypothetical protein [Opitutae bacterium]|tara:strand:- start:20977 stop:21978 length:1002 start_codon:yes stop_codon:yes gene_type:complete
MTEQLQDTLSMFAFLAIELSILFIGISLLVGALQRHIPPAKIEVLLSAGRGRSYLLAAALGAMTPFCSCSTIPMLKGLIRARAGFGPMMVFLFASPLLNPIIVVLLAATFGLQLTMIYTLAALLVSLVAGYLLQVFGFERTIRSDVLHASDRSSHSTQGDDLLVFQPVVGGCCESPVSIRTESACCGEDAGKAQVTAKGRYHGLWREAWSDFVEVLPYLLLGIGIGSVIYGYMPAAFLEQVAGEDNPFAIPIAAVIGVPLYIRAEAVIPLAAALMSKGVGAGTVLALIIGSAGASLTELILLRSLFTARLLLVFVVVIFAMAMLAGYTTYLLH